MDYSDARFVSENSSTDFLLSACLFQKQASLLFGKDSTLSPSLSSYFSSLWLQESPDDVSAGLTKKIQATVCPHCGITRNVENFSVRVKSRKKYARTVARNLSRTVKTHSATRSSGKIAADHVESFTRSRNHIILHCKNCSKCSDMTGVTRKDQRERLDRGKAVRTGNAKVDTPIKAQVAPSTLTFLSQKTQLKSPDSSSPISSGKKKRKKDLNAGLRISLPVVSNSKPTTSLPAVPVRTTGLFSSTRPAPSNAQSALQKFLQ